MPEVRLGKAAAAVVNAPVDDRIRFLRESRWIEYDRAKTILDRLEVLYRTPKRDRMPCMLIVGETNNGKTELIKRFMQRHPADENLQGEAMIQPIIYVQAPPGPNEGALYDQIFKRFFQAQKANETVPAKRDRVLYLLEQVQLRMLIIDEVHHLLSGTALQQRNFLNALKFLTNDLRIPIVAIGTEDAEHAMATSPEVENRFLKEPMPRWIDSSELVSLLGSFQQYLPLREPYDLFAEDLAPVIVTRGDGKIGEMSDFATEAAIYAIKNGIEKITPEVLRNCEYRGPEERKARVRQALRRP